MRFPAYSAYKDSGVNWLGEIPEGWSIKPLWALFRRHKLTGFPDEQLLSVYRDYGVIPKASRDDNFNKPSDDLGAYQLVQVGDLAINKMKAWQGSVGISSHNGIVSPAYHVYAPSHSEAPQYLHHLFRCNEYIAGYLANSKGIRVNQWDLEPQQHSRMSVLLPSFQEQTQIARFLDHETAHIDALIEEQQRLIELLKEKRQAVISQAVTKGLDPTVPMKDSGVEWLGEVPVHWEVTQVKRRCELITDGAHISPETENGVYCFVSTRDVSDEGIDFEGCLRTSASSYEYLLKTGCQPAAGDVLFSKDGTIGRTIVVSENSPQFVVASSLIIIRPDREELLPSYLDFLCQSWVVSQQVEGFVKGAGLPRLSIQNLTKVVGVFPPLEEQALIAEFLQVRCAATSQLTGEAWRTMELLKERRSALISAAVTGKIDVRGWQPPANAPTPELAQEVV